MWQTMACKRYDRIQSNDVCVDDDDVDDDDDDDADDNVGNGVDDNMVYAVDHGLHHVYDDDGFDHSTWDYGISSNGSTGMTGAISLTRRA